MIKSLVKKFGGVLRYFPFINTIKLGKNTLVTNGSVLFKSRIICSGTGNSIVFGKNCLFKYCRIHINGNNNKIVIGDHCYAINAELWIEDNNNSINIGNNSRLAGTAHIACIEGQTVSIGNDCLFSSDIIIRTGDSHSITDLTGNRINPSCSVNIGNHVWIGNRVIVLKGVTIPNDCIVGTGAIVTRGFEEHNSVIAGVPAKVIKQNVNWNNQRIQVKS